MSPPSAPPRHAPETPAPPAKRRAFRAETEANDEAPPYDDDAAVVFMAVLADASRFAAAVFDRDDGVMETLEVRARPPRPSTRRASSPPRVSFTPPFPSSLAFFSSSPPRPPRTRTSSRRSGSSSSPATPT